jgi:VWFA-related protein
MTMLWLILAAAPAQAAPVSFSASVESVYVDVFVTGEKGPVTGLRAGDFELRDNGVVQRADMMPLESLPLTTILVLDTSASVVGSKLDQLKAAIRALLRRLRPGDEVALVAFGNEIAIPVPATRDLQAVEQALDGLRPGGQTAVYDAVYAAALLAPERSRSQVVLFTDGDDNLSALDLADVLRVLERSDVMLHAVGIVAPGGDSTWRLSAGGIPDGDAYGPGGRGQAGAQTVVAVPVPPTVASEHAHTLRRLAEATGGRFWAASAPKELTAAFGAIAEAMRTRYVLKYEPHGVVREGRHTLAVRLTERRGVVHSRNAYFVAPAPR